MTPHRDDLSRPTRSSTLPSHSPDSPSGKRHHHSHHNPSHKHNRSHQITRHVAEQLPSLSQTTSPLGELFSPVRSVAGGLSELTRWNNSSGEREKRDKSSERATDSEKGESGKSRRRREATWEQVKRAKAKRLHYEKALQTQYNQLATSSTDIALSLAQSHTSLLSTLPPLTDTLNSLRSLSASSSTLLQTFTQTSIPSLTSTHSSQITTLNQTFSRVENDRIKGLETRLTAAREKVGNLGERMRNVKDRVEMWEQREIQEGRWRKRRVGCVWGAMAIGALVFVILVGGRKSAEEARMGKVDWVGMMETNGSNDAALMNWTERVVTEVRNGDLEVESEVGTEGGKKSRWGSQRGEQDAALFAPEDEGERQGDDRLERLFAEL